MNPGFTSRRPSAGGSQSRSDGVRAACHAHVRVGMRRQPDKRQAVWQFKRGGASSPRCALSCDAAGVA